VNVQPVTGWDEAVDVTTALYEEAHLARLTTEKFMLDGRHTGTGGGNHIVLGGLTPADSPFLRRPELLRSLTLLDTTADPEPEQNKGPYRRLAFIGRWLSFRMVINPLMKIMFGRSFLEDPARAAVRERWKNHLLSLERVGTTRAAHGVIDREGVYDRLGEITTPTLIVVGSEDVATVPAKSERMHAAIPGSVYRKLPRGGHSSTIEEPELVTEAMQQFFDQNL
jgi:pimeloyl-ACP methyl ester carboxylesterase